jgi:hypothetical protein
VGSGSAGALWGASSGIPREHQIADLALVAGGSRAQPESTDTQLCGAPRPPRKCRDTGYRWLEQDFGRPQADPLTALVPGLGRTAPVLSQEVPPFGRCGSWLRARSETIVSCLRRRKN